MLERNLSVDKKIQGIVKVVEMLAIDEDLRKSFLIDAGATLEEMGVIIKDKKLLNDISANLKELIEKQILVVDDRFDPVGPAANAAVATGVITGVITGATTAVVSVTTADITTRPEITTWEKIDVDFSKVTLREKVTLGELRIKNLEKMIRPAQFKRKKNKL